VILKDWMYKTVAAATAVALAIACSDTSSVKSANVASVSVTPATASLVQGTTQQLTASARDAAGAVLTGRTITWSSSAPTVATASATGLVTTVAIGTATISATAEGIAGTAAITVTPVPVASVTVTPATAGLVLGTTQQLTASARDAAGAVLTGRTITWSSSAPTVATVSATGLVTTVAIGTATISATAEGIAGTAAITVTPVPVASVSVTPASAALPVGTTQQLTASARSAAGAALDRAVTWTSGAPSVATVSAAGLVTALAAGSATITATAEGIAGTAVITVTPIATIAIAPVSGLQAGLAAQVTATFRSASGTIDPTAPITWRSSDSTRAAIDASGLLVARTPGAVTLTAQSGNTTGTLVVSIGARPEPASCKLPRLSSTVNAGFPRFSTRLKSVGNVRMTVVFVDFSDKPATRTPESMFTSVSPAAEQRFSALSYGKMVVTLTPNLRWFRMSKPSTEYGPVAMTYEGQRQLLQEAADLASATTDFSQTDAIVVLTNPDASAFRVGPALVANGAPAISVQGRTIFNGTNSGSDFFSWGGGPWLVHEIGHTLSLPDLYDLAPGTKSTHMHMGEFSHMGMINGRAQEWTGFERWQLSWLDNDQVLCAPAGTTMAHLAPLVGTGSQKLLLIPVSSTKAIAVESRRARGYDAQLPQPGLLVYLVDTQISTGRGVMRLLPEDDADASKLTRTLVPGGSVTHLGVTVTFFSSIGEQELVRIQR
jgi:M6 family metalloprotease-like protein